MSNTGLSLAERMNVSVPGGRAARAKTGASARSGKPYGTSQRSSGRFSDGETKRDFDSKWTHDKFATHNGIEGGELGARLGGTVGRQITSGTEHSSRLVNRAFAGVLGKPPMKRAASESSGLSIKGASAAAGTGVEVEGLAPGTTSEDVAEIFSRCGSISEHRLLSVPSAPSVRVFLQFETPQGAGAAVSQFDKQTADGRTLKVFIVSAGSLGSRLGVEGRKGPPKSHVDLLGDSSSFGGMRSDELIRVDPRAKVITDPSGVNKLLEPAQSKPASSGPRRGGRGGGRGRGGPGRGGAGRSLSDRMELD